MKVRESGMPAEETWSEFFEPKKVLRTLGIDKTVRDIADFGCGYGTFTIPVAQTVKGKVYALDIEPKMAVETKRKAEKRNLGNVETIVRDFVSDGSGLENESVDYVMLFNILNLNNPRKLLREAYRILRKGGKLGIIHWNYDSQTPRGPPMEIRPKPEQCVEWAKSSGFNHPIKSDLKPYHYGIVLTKGEDKE